jgi:plasminogen activator inhibitor 1 RNA-binding protein
MEYGVAVNNKFALFDDEGEDPLEVLQRSQEEASKKATAAKGTKENANAKVSAKNAKNTAKDTKPVAKLTSQPAKVLTPAQEQKPKPATQNQGPRRENATEKPPRFRQNENNTQRERRPPRDENRDQPKTDSDFRPERFGDREESGGGRSGFGGGYRRGGGRGSGRGARSEDSGFDRFGKREFERHSGSDRTGLKPVEKREGGGAHNWGTIADAVAEQEQLVAKEAVEPTADADAANLSNEEPTAEVETAEPEEKTMTLDEWKAMQDDRRAKASFNIRKAGEGVSAAPEWKKMYQLKKKVNEEPTNEEVDEEGEEEEVQSKQRTVNIQIKFNDSGPRGGGGGGGGFRGRGRGGRGGGGRGGGSRDGFNSERGGRQSEAVPNVDNELDFPSLS